MSCRRFTLAATLLVVVVAVGCAGPSRRVGAKEACVTCHQEDRKLPTFPVHTTAGFPTTCERCHNQQAWKPATFSHTGLPLIGGHSNVDCQTCHAKEPVPKTCVGCHEKDRGRPKTPDHRAQGFSTDCGSCHTVAAWIPASSVDHSKFPLIGKHAGAPCDSCHTSSTAPPTTCFGCHEKDRARPTDPDHVRANFPTTCDSCHTPHGWVLKNFAHSTKFPLSGRHGTLTCGTCHDRSPLPTTCVGCHDKDRSRPKPPSPDHLAAGFSTSCESCHTTNGWKPATAVDHTKFPLTGKHAGVTCNSCHDKKPVPTTCVGCHDADRKTPKLPNHLAAGFSTDCTACHTTAGWKPSTFDHEKLFPIAAGKHSGKTCASCHTDPAKPKVVSCLGCHEHRASKMNDTHKGENGYSYTTAACLKCHPRGRKK